MMAFSKSISKGQFQINCQLCESNPKIQWKCKDCNLLMCQTCRDKIHPKFKDASKHQIWDIKEIGILSGRDETNIDFSSIPCQKHEGQCYCLFCKDCNYLVCATCISTTHNGHKMGEIKELYETNMNNVKKKQTEVKINERRLKEDELTLEKIKQSKSESYDKAKKNILDRKTVLTEAVATYADKLLSDLDQGYERSFKAYNEGKKNIQKFKFDLNKQSIELEDISSTTEAAIFFKEIENLTLDKTALISIKLQDDIVAEFASGEIMQSNFGSLQKIKKISKGKILLETPTEFQNELDTIHLVVVDNNNSLWLSDKDSYLLQKVKHEGNNLEVLHSFNINTSGIFINESNDLLLCTWDSRIKQINNGTDQVVDSIYNVAPFGAVSIHITKDKVIAGVKTKQRAAAVIVMDLEGKQQAIYQHDSNTKPLFKWPWYITCTDNGNIFVVDVDYAAEKCKIIVLETAGKVINTFEGRKEININDQFKCFNVATTPRDNVIVPDQENDLLYFLDSDGNYITHYTTKDIGILSPVSLAFSTDGQLYIGCSHKDDKDKLYKVNFYEF